MLRELGDTPIWSQHQMLFGGWPVDGNNRRCPPGWQVKEIKSKISQSYNKIWIYCIYDFSLLSFTRRHSLENKIYGRYHAVFLYFFACNSYHTTTCLPPLVTKVNPSSSTIVPPFRCEAFCFFASSYSNSVLVPKVRQKNVAMVEISENWRPPFFLSFRRHFLCSFPFDIIEDCYLIHLLHIGKKTSVGVHFNHSQHLRKETDIRKFTFIVLIQV